MPEARVDDPSEWGPSLELALEAEFWDTIVNSDHAHYPAWRDKTKRYIDANPAASPKMTLYVTAGGVFQMTRAFSGPEPDLALAGADLVDALAGAPVVARELPDDPSAQVFAHNTLAMRGLLLGPRAAGLDELETMLGLPGSEGRAAAPFTYGMLEDEDAVRYAIALTEGCETFVCNWTTELAPYKPIGQLLMLAELHAMVGEQTEMDATLDRAAALAKVRGWPFIARIDALRATLRTRTYRPGAEVGLDGIRWPMPVYSDEVNCSTCHVGGRPGSAGVPLAAPYPGADDVTPAPAPPSFRTR